MRVVSLLPSATEICYALGVEPVAVSHECDYPPTAADRPAVNRSRVSNDGDSAAVNEQVAAAEADGGVYEIDRDALAAADPDLVIAQGVCDVCAIDGGLARAAVADAGLDAAVLELHPHSIGDVLADVERVGDRVGRPDAATALTDRLRQRIAAVEAVAADADARPTVTVLDWMAPPMVAGHWIPELVELAGGRYGLTGAGEPSTPIEWSAIRAFDPDVLVAAPCGFELDRVLDNREELTARTGWDGLAAVTAGRVHAMDGHDYVNRPGPRLVDTLEYLAALLHPDRFDAPPADAVRPLLATRPA